MNAIDPFSLEKTLSKIIQGQSDLETAQQAQQELLQPVNTNLLNEGQGFKGLWSNPTDNQRQGILQTGLSLLSTHDTNNLSQRIGQAIGQGMSSIQEGRQLDQKRQLSQSGLDIQRLQGRQQHNQAMAGIGIQLNQQQVEMANRLADMQREERHRVEDRAFDLHKDALKRGEIDQLGTFTFLDGGEERHIPVGRTGESIVLLNDNKTPLFDALTDEQIMGGTYTPASSGGFNLEFGEDGQLKRFSTGRGTTGRPTKHQLESSEMVSELPGASTLGIGILNDPSLEKVVGPVQSIFGLTGESGLTKAVVSPEARTAASKMQNYSILSALPFARTLAPVTEVDLESLKVAKGMDTSLHPSEIANVFWTQQMPAVGNLIFAKKSAQQGFNVADGVNAHSRFAEGLYNEQFRTAGSVGPVTLKRMREVLPPANKAVKGKGYFVTQDGKLMSQELVNIFVDQTRSSPEEVIDVLGLRPY